MLRGTTTTADLNTSLCSCAEQWECLTVTLKELSSIDRCAGLLPKSAIAAVNSHLVCHDPGRTSLPASYQCIASCSARRRISRSSFSRACCMTILLQTRELYTVLLTAIFARSCSLCHTLDMEPIAAPRSVDNQHVINGLRFALMKTLPPAEGTSTGLCPFWAPGAGSRSWICQSCATGALGTPAQVGFPALPLHVVSYSRVITAV